MRVQALLCDAATVREGLLHILGGGLTQVWRESFPSPLGASLALLITLHSSETGERHGMRIILQSEDGETLVNVEAEFQAEKGPGWMPGHSPGLPMVISLMGVMLPAAGSYSVEITVDRQHCFSLPFMAALVPSMVPPPSTN